MDCARVYADYLAVPRGSRRCCCCGGRDFRVLVGVRRSARRSLLLLAPRHSATSSAVSVAASAARRSHLYGLFPDRRVSSSASLPRCTAIVVVDRSAEVEEEDVRLPEVLPALLQDRGVLLLRHGARLERLHHVHQ